MIGSQQVRICSMRPLVDSCLQIQHLVYMGVHENMCIMVTHILYTAPKLIYALSGETFCD